MRRTRTSRRALLAATVTALLLVGQVAAGSPVRADDPSAAAPRESGALRPADSRGSAAWNLLAAMNVARGRVAVAAAGGKVYVIGGQSARSAPEGTLPRAAPGVDSSGEASATRAIEAEVEEYNPATNTWTTRAAKPWPLSNIGAGVIDGIIYIPGGYKGDSPFQIHEAYDPATDTWSRKESVPWPLQGAAVAATGGKLYVLGGLDQLNTPQDTTYVYDPAQDPPDPGENPWTIRTSMPAPRFFGAAAVVDGKIYVVGGFDFFFNEVATVERYDPASNTWATLAPMSTARGGPGAVGYNGLVYVCGGGWNTYLDTCETYNPATNTWTPFPSMNVGRRTFGMAEAGGTLYAEGGWNGSYLGTNEAYAIGAPPGAFGKTAPANGATGQSTWPTLSWGASAGATNYQYCYDTTNNGTCDGIWLNSGGGTIAALADLSSNTAYWWQVRAVNAFGTTYADAGPWWQFTTTSPTMLQMSFRSIGSQDGWILERGEDSTKGSDILDSTATTGRVGDNSADRQYRSILAFDTSALPDGAVISGITLYIRRQRIVGSNPFTFYNPNQKKGLNLLKVDMQAGYYHDDPNLERFDFHAIGVRGNVGRFIKTPVDRWYRAPLRSRCYALLNLRGVTQFRLRFDLDDNDDMSADYVSFYTGDAAWADRPELIVEYYIP